MTNKINGVDARPVSVTGSTPVPRARDATAGEDGAGTSMGSASVSITEGARQLASLEKAIAALPVVDDARVAAASLAIEQGRYQVDGQKVADKLLRMDYDLTQAGGDEK